MLKKIQISIFLIGICLIINASPHPVDILYYKIDAHFDGLTHQLEVSLLMTCVDPVDMTIELKFNHFAQVGSISLEGNAKNEIRYSFFAVDSIRMCLPDKTDIRKPIVIDLKYSIPLDSVSGSKSFVFSLSRPEKWYPLQYNDLSTHTITIDIPGHFSALSSGNLISETTMNNRKQISWNDNYNFTCPLFIFNSDSLEYIEKEANKTKLNFFFYTQDKTLLDDYITGVSAAFKYFDALFGNDYPYKTYSFLEVPDYPAGSAVGSMQVFGTTLISDYYTYGRLYALKPAFHEVAHEWWGIGRLHFKDRTNDPGLQFLRESVNEYLTYMFIEHYWGKDSMDKCLDTAKTYCREYITEENDKPLYEVPQQFSSWEEAVIVYYKGPLIVNELRRMLGDEKWVAFIRKYYSMYQDQYATYDDFLKVLADFDSTGKISVSLNNYLKKQRIPGISQRVNFRNSCIR
jgi:hypothetical protein